MLPNLQKDKASVAAGFVGRAAVGMEIDADHNATIVSDPPCYCRNGIVCITCLSWNRRNTEREQRRAASLRLQALGALAAGG
jgi:hypothetical protein